MNAVILDGDVSYPPTSGKRLRTLHLMLRLAQRHAITYICRCDAGSHEAKQAREYLSDHGLHVVLVNDPVARKAGPLFYARLARNLLSPLPYSVASHVSPAMRQAVMETSARQQVDLWQLEWTAYLYAMAGMPQARKLVIAHNVDSLIWQRYAEHEANPVKRWYIQRQWRKFERFERQAFAAADRVVAVSPEDARLVREQFGQPRVDVVENGIDRAAFEMVHRQPEPKRILFLGALDWRPNLDAVNLLMDEVMPQVLLHEPEAELCVVGRNPPPGLVERLGHQRRTVLHANVADVRPFLASSAVMAVPLRIGGGSRLKILEALACGLPVVSTTVGAEGLDLQTGRDITLADGTVNLSAALVDALRRPGAQQVLADRGRERVLEQYDWDALAGKLEESWEKCVTDAREVCPANEALRGQ